MKSITNESYCTGVKCVLISSVEDTDFTNSIIRPETYPKLGQIKIESNIKRIQNILDKMKNTDH